MKFIISILCLLGCGVVVTLVLNQYLPKRYHPFAPLTISDVPTFVTKFKVKRLKDDPIACFDALNAANIDYQPVPDRETGEQCGLYNTVKLLSSSVSYGNKLALTCPALVSLMLWEQHDLQSLALETIGQKITEVRTYGTYACRNVNSRTVGRRSEHAFANAIDVAGFVTHDGATISVLNDWDSDNARGKFVRAIHDAACQHFATVLGPEYNSLHADHFHFDMGRGWACK